MIQQFSPNMLKTFQECPKKFHLKYVKNVTMPVNDEIFETGKNIHALASYYLKKQDISKLEQALNNDEKTMWEYLKKTVYTSFGTINTEYNLTFKLENYFFSGRLDALVKDENKFYILDYKTGSAPKEAKYDFQTIIYLLAVKKYFKTNNIEFVYLDLKRQTNTCICFDEKLELEYEKRLIDIANRINTENYVKNLQICPCEYKILCF
ncbi:PD-(D/E)XK nuclease family protein [bacterium]|nr:PD-(D/E)XK nuclease family protein [bacterium]